MANLIEGRAGMQVLHRWKKVLKPGIVKGPWSEEENRVIILDLLDGIL